MRRTGTIWLMYAAIVLTVFFCSCAGTKPQYVRSTEVAGRDNKKQKTIVSLHIAGLMFCGWILFQLDEDSK